MHFPDEHYNRVFTRKTLTNRQLKWQGRAVMHAMLGGDEFDRAGVFEFRGDPVECIACVTELPEEIVRLGLEKLVETETWVITDRAIVWPEYTAAQTCARGDKLRQSDSRKWRAANAGAGATPAPRLQALPDPPTADAPPAPRLQALPDPKPDPEPVLCHDSSRPVTPSHEPSRPVTPSHEPSQPVTPSHEPSRPVTLYYAVPDLTEESMSSPPPAAVDPPTARPTELPAIREVFHTWQRVHGHLDAKLDAKRTARIRAGLKLFSAAQLVQAIRGALKDDWLMGRDPKSPRKYDGLETILRDAAKIEALIDLETGKVQPIRRAMNGSLQPDAGRTGAEHFRGIRV